MWNASHTKIQFKLIMQFDWQCQNSGNFTSIACVTDQTLHAMRTRSGYVKLAHMLHGHAHF